MHCEQVYSCKCINKFEWVETGEWQMIESKVKEDANEL